MFRSFPRSRAAKKGPYRRCGISRLSRRQSTSEGEACAASAARGSWDLGARQWVLLALHTPRSPPAEAHAARVSCGIMATEVSVIARWRLWSKPRRSVDPSPLGKADAAARAVSGSARASPGSRLGVRPRADRSRALGPAAARSPPGPRQEVEMASPQWCSCGMRQPATGLRGAIPGGLPAGAASTEAAGAGDKVAREATRGGTASATGATITGGSARPPPCSSSGRNLSCAGARRTPRASQQ